MVLAFVHSFKAFVSGTAIAPCVYYTENKRGTGGAVARQSSAKLYSFSGLSLPMGSKRAPCDGGSPANLGR